MDLFQMSISATVLITVFIILRALTLNKLPKRTFLILWGVVLCRLMIPFSIPSHLSIYTGIGKLSQALDAATVQAVPTDIPATIPFTPTIPAENIDRVADGGTFAAWLNISSLMLIWLIGLCAVALFFTITYIKCRRVFKNALPAECDFISTWQRQHSLRREVHIKQSDRIKAPLTYGVFNPVLLLPKVTDWTDETKLQYILSHEYVHIKRFDALFKLALTSAVCVHWFNPLVWAMFILANKDIELSCDEAVVRMFGAAAKSDYAMTLIGLEEKKSQLTPLCNSFSKTAIEERITAIMKIKKYSIPVIVVAALLIIGVTVACTTSKTSAGDNADVQNNPEASISSSPSPSQNASDATTENTAEVTPAENNKTENRISLEQEIAAEEAAGITVDGIKISRIMVAPSTTAENVHIVYHPVSGKYHLERTDPVTGEKMVSVDDGTTWLYYRMNKTTKAQEISVDSTTWSDLEPAVFASEYCNCMFYLSKNDPATGKALNLISYDYGKTWLHDRNNDQTHAHEISADGVTWQPAPTEW